MTVLSDPIENSPIFLLVYTAIFFFAIVFRYFVAAGVFYYYYYVKNFSRYDQKRLSKRLADKKQVRKEMLWSIKSSVIFAFFGTLTYWLWLEGKTAIYLEVDQFGYWYLPLSLVLLSLLHETYYYWVHRWMHHPKVFRIVHKVHHDSRIPTPWTAFSFHPWESVIEAVIVPLILLVLPVNVYVLGFYLLIMTISSVVNHLDIEIYPTWFQKSKFGQQFIGATHHHHHHTEYMTNYGLYFTFWDRIMATESRKMKS
ncbi:sterol desaturase family protein [Salinimicrobium oceani]|uniref:Sterol desaturase family protein n=1 Tax=Salinimicrobium oceani TaxID=2722702 RepID=A0ABX1CWE7_9FLAO|nr:sterol desaturase family protein [Salinimicrobium oceani]NJW52594.1 sterol desaturase family protein [Salinimicrobium oceani]